MGWFNHQLVVSSYNTSTAPLPPMLLSSYFLGLSTTPSRKRSRTDADAAEVESDNKQLRSGKASWRSGAIGKKIERFPETFHPILGCPRKLVNG